MYLLSICQLNQLAGTVLTIGDYEEGNDSGLFRAEETE